MKKCLIAAVAAFVFVFVFDFIFHGVLLQGIYKETAALWRPEAEMQKYMGFMALSQLLFAVFMTLTFSRFEGGTVKDGVRFGAYMGGIFFAMNIGMYAYLPLPSLTLPLIWSVGGVLQTIGIGVILALLLKPAKAS